MSRFARSIELAQRHLNLFPFMSTAKIQSYLESQGLLLDGRTIAGMRATLHRNMVRIAA